MARSTVTGDGEPGSTVSVELPDGTTITGTVPPGGTFTLTSPTPQPPGDVTTTVTDGGGNTSPPTTTTYVDTTAPLPPTGIVVTPNPDGTLIITGGGEPGSTVSIELPDGTTITTTVPPGGTFTLTSPTPQPPGDVTATQTDGGGNTSPPTTTTYVDTTAPLPPTGIIVSQNPDGTLAISGGGEPGSIVSVELPDGSVITTTVPPGGTFTMTSPTPQTTGDVTVTQTDRGGNPSTPTTTTFTDNYAPLAPTGLVVTQNPDGTVNVLGTGEPGSTVEVTFPDGTIVTTTVPPSGTFSLTSTTPQTVGTIGIKQTDAAGNISPTTSRAFDGNVAPVAAPGTASTAYLTPVKLDFLSTATDFDGDVLTVASATVPVRQGTMELVGSDWVFKPASGFAGNATVTYTVRDPDGLTSTSTYEVAVAQPILKAVPGQHLSAKGGPVSSSVTKGDTYPADAVFRVLGATKHGTLTMKPDGTFKYTPKSGFSGVERFTYSITDKFGRTVTATETIKVEAKSFVDKCLTTFSKLKGRKAG